MNGVTHHVRARGDTRAAKDSMLPIVRQRKNAKLGDIPATKIPLYQVSQAWIKTKKGRKFGSLKYIAGWVASEEDVDMAADGGDEDEEDEEDAGAGEDNE